MPGNTKIKLRILLFIFGLCIYHESLCQTVDKRTDFQTWTDLTLTYNKSNKFSFGGDMGTRGIISHKNWNQFYVRPTVHYKFSSLFKVSGGVGSFNTFNRNLDNSYEFRIFQDFQFAWPNLGWINFNHRFRFEERFFFYENTENVFSMRGRYLVGLKTTNFKFIGKDKNYYLNTMWEAFVPLGESATELFINNQRWYMAMGYHLTKTWQFELHYIFQKSRLIAEDGFKSQESILRLRIFHTLKLAD